MLAERAGHWVLARTYAEKAKTQYEELADRANLDIKGTDHDGKKIRGVVAIKKMAGNRRVLDQSLYFDQ